MGEFSSDKNSIRLDYENECIWIDVPNTRRPISFLSSNIQNIVRFNLKIKNILLDIIAIEEKSYGWSFLIKDWNEYSKLLAMINNPDMELVNTLGVDKKNNLKEYEFFFYRLCFAMSYAKYASSESRFHDKLKEVYNVKYYSDIENRINLDVFWVSQYTANLGSVILVQDNFDTLYRQVREFLPTEIKAAKEKQKNEQRELLIYNIQEQIKNINSQPAFNSEEYKKVLSETDLDEEFELVNKEILYWNSAKELNAVDNEAIEHILVVLNEKKSLINKACEKILRQEIVDHYGSVELLKTNLLKSLKGMGFQEALGLYHTYQNEISELEDCINECQYEISEDVYDTYLTFFRHASVFVSNYLNEINKIKSKRKNIPQRYIDDALKYMYCTDSVEEAIARQQEKDYLENRSFGSKGEAEVEYALKWLVGDYLRVEATESGKYGEKAIILNNKAFIDEPQEFDHIIIGKQGIFNIETKNYVGKLIVDKNGNWIRIKTDGTEVGERNPMQQIRRHEAVLRSIVGENVPIISILVMANPKMIIEGVENCDIPLIKADRLEEYISNYSINKELSKHEMDAIFEQIEEHRTTKN